MKKKDGVRNFTELTEEEKCKILDTYLTTKLTVKDIGKQYKLTKRSMTTLLKHFGIDSRKKNRYTLNEDFFQEINTEQQAYWLGFLFADGFVGDQAYNNIVFSQAFNNKWAISHFANAIDFSGELRYVEPGRAGGYSSDQPHYVINFSSKKMVQDLNNLGLSHKKENRTKIPETIPEYLIHHFIRGIFDGDGSISYSLKSNTIHSSRNVSFVGNQSLMQDISQWFNLQKTNLNNCNHSDKVKYLQYGSKNDIMSVFLKLYQDATIFLPRKFFRWSFILGDIGGHPLNENEVNLFQGCLELFSRLTVEVNMQLASEENLTEDRW